MVDGTDVHITRESDGQTASIALTEHDDKVRLEGFQIFELPEAGCF